MKAEIVSIEDITPQQIVQWNDWAAPNDTLISPYLRFEFAETVARARKDVKVAVFRDADGLAGFFPHHAPREGVTRPVGAPMSDYQGIIARDYSRFSPNILLRAVGASAIVYDNWYCAAGGHTPSRRDREGSVIADLSGGADAYFAGQKALHKDHFKKAARRARAAERDFGPVHVELGDADGHAFAALTRWKETQYRETGKLNVFGIGWVRDVLTNLRRREGQEFSGLTASLWFGDHLVAVEFGLVAANVYHSWFPAYNPDFAKYSPGLLLLHGLFEQMGERGLSRADLGRGGGHYKKYYASYEVPLDQGRMLRPGMAAAGIVGWELGEKAARIMPDKLADIPLRTRRRWAQVSAFEHDLGARLSSMATALAS